MDIANILSEKFKGAEWSLNGDDYSGLNWSASNTLPKPTEAKLSVLNTEIETENKVKKIKEQKGLSVISSIFDPDLPTTVQIAMAPYMALVKAHLDAKNWIKLKEVLQGIPLIGESPSDKALIETKRAEWIAMIDGVLI